MDKYEIWVSEDGSIRKLIPFRMPLSRLIDEVKDDKGQIMRLVAVFEAASPDDAQQVFHETTQQEG